MTQHKDVVVAAVDEELVHDALCDAHGDDGRCSQDVDGGHDHQHLGQGHLTQCAGVLFRYEIKQITSS